MKKVYLDGMGKRGTRIAEEIRKNNMFEIVNSPTEADGIIISTPPETHYSEYLKYKGAKMLIEKPMCLSYKKATCMNNIMMGNNYMFSDVLVFLTAYFQKHNVKVKSIHSDWLKSVDIKTDVCYDLGYHHIYIHAKIFGKIFKKMKITNVSDKTKSIILSFGENKSIINVSHSNNHKFYRNDFNIETNIGTFYILEKNNIMKLYSPSENLICSSDTGLYNELKLFSKFIDGKYKYDNLIDKNIVKWLEKAVKT
ncbi:MAG: hypothetical protein WC916_04525 [Candidatus Woesearchaeota archaeon]